MERDLTDPESGPEAALETDVEEPRAEGPDGEAAVPAGDPEASAEESSGDSAEDPGPEPHGSAGDDPRGAEDEAQDDESEAAKGPGPGEDLTDDELVRSVAALVFASPDPLGTNRLWQLLERPRKERVKAAMEELGRRLEQAGLPLELRAIAGGWRLLTTPDHAEVVLRLSKVRKNERISPAALETLAIVAYRQPVTKAEIEAIRGVQAGALLRSLSERGLVRVAGRADQPGAPLQYGTTREFLDRFGLESLKDLPRDGELLGG